MTNIPEAKDGCFLPIILGAFLGAIFAIYLCLLNDIRNDTRQIKKHLGIVEKEK